MQLQELHDIGPRPLKRILPGRQDPRSRGPRSSSQGSLHILGAMAWASVGYMALTVADFREFKREYGSDLAEGRSLCGTSAQFPSGFVESRMKAMVLTRKDRVRRLGGAPSDGDKAVKMHLRAAGEQFKDAIQCTNYVILHLKTKDNIADAISRRELQLEADVVRRWWSPFQELPFPGQVQVDADLGAACLHHVMSRWPEGLGFAR